MRRTTSDQQIVSSPDNEVVRRLRRIAARREPGLVLLEGPRVLAEAKAAGLAFDLIAVREQKHVDQAVLERDGKAELEHPGRDFAQARLQHFPALSPTRVN